MPSQNKGIINMKIGAIGSNPYRFNRQNSTSFKGDSRPFIINMGSREDIPKELDTDNFRTDSIQLLEFGEKPVKKLEGSYSPDNLVTGTIYYADHFEPVGDFVRGTHSVVVAEEKYMKPLTIERLLDNENDSPTVVNGQRYCLWHDVRYNKNKLKRMNIEIEPIDEADRKLLEEKGEQELHQSIKDAKETASTDEEKAIARYREVREMRRIVERTHLEILDEMERMNIDYYGRSKHPIPLIKVPDYEP